ncbi:Extracellular exo-alpha-(1-_5)-L-arabinofuranosidase precursor [compost metagenome]
MNKLTLLFLLFFGASANAQINTEKTFTNPILPAGADPWVIFSKGYYYYTQTTGKDLAIWKSKSMVDLRNTSRKVIWIPPTDKSYSKQLWAPELHHIHEKWYMYFSADDGDNKHHRLYVIENSSEDPTEGKWVFKGQITDPSNKWAIDGNLFEHKGNLYMMWSGWEGNENGQQNIYIAKMKNPWTIIGNRVKISGSDYDWEKYGDLGKHSNPPHVNVNEGPQFLANGKKMFVIYSASGCWTDYYALGMLTANIDADPMKASSWIKSAQPVFKSSVENGVYATGHNSFFKSADGKEDWILYHANSAPGQGCGGKRSPRMQRFSWNADGSPNFGIPSATNVQIPVPSTSK